MPTETDLPSSDEFDEEEPQRSPLEFRGPNGLIVRELVSLDDAEEMLEFINANRDTFVDFAKEFERIQSVLDASKMLANQEFSTYGAKKPATAPLAALATIAQETDDRVSLGYAVGKKFQRQGIASGLVRTVAHSYLGIPQIKTVRCYVNPHNTASRRLLAQCGFHESGGTPFRNVFYDLDKPMAAGR